MHVTPPKQSDRVEEPFRIRISANTMAAMVETETIIKLSLNVPPQLVSLPSLWPEMGRSATTAQRGKAREKPARTNHFPASICCVAMSAW